LTHNKAKSLYSLRKTPIQQRSKTTVDAVLEAGARLLLSIGYDKASTNKIAELAGVSVGSLYEYFPGKEAIFAEIRRREDQRHYDLIMAESTPTTLNEMLRLQLSIYIKLVRTNLELHVALAREVPLFATIDAESKIASDYIPRSNEFLSLQASKLRPKCEIPIVVELVMRVVRATINDYALHAPERLEDTVVTDQLLDMLQQYLLH
jgi:AcrR family transcriptional regulator